MELITLEQFVTRFPTKKAAADALDIAPNTLWNRLNVQPWSYLVQVRNHVEPEKQYKEVAGRRA